MLEFFKTKFIQRYDSTTRCRFIVYRGQTTKTKINILIDTHLQLMHQMREQLTHNDLADEVEIAKCLKSAQITVARTRSYSKLLINSGVTSSLRLSYELIKNPKFLECIGFETNDIDVIKEYLAVDLKGLVVCRSQEQSASSSTLNSNTEILSELANGVALPTPVSKIQAHDSSSESLDVMVVEISDVDSAYEDSSAIDVACGSSSDCMLTSVSLRDASIPRPISDPFQDNMAMTNSAHKSLGQSELWTPAVAPLIPGHALTPPIRNQDTNIGHYHPGGYDSSLYGWECCCRKRKDDVGCKVGSPRFHLKEFDMHKSKWPCCKANRRVADGCKSGTHPSSRKFAASTVVVA